MVLVNFYAQLELTDEADEAEIKKAYRRLVLRWHPDKNPKERPKAEELIRLINTAYATLSNPTKREKYDLQRYAVDKTKKKAPKPRKTEKVSVPKEFMMQPLGFPNNFVRYTEKKTSVPARQDMQHLKFKEFFETTKFSLWWVPEQNNQCRVRALGSKSKADKRGVTAGLAGGLNMSFKIKEDCESEVMLAAADKGKRKETVDFVVKDSSEFDGAVRFETAARRGHYLAFFPPHDLRVVPLLNEQEGRVLDFMLTDFTATLKFKDLEEVLVPVAEKFRGAWVPLATLRESKEVSAYFQKVMKIPLWEVEDFGAYFEGHWTQWEYNAADQLVRLRPLNEKLSKVLGSATSSGDVAAAVLHAGEELSSVNLSGALRAIQMLGKADAEYKESGGKSDGAKVERQKLLQALPAALNAMKAQAEKAAEAPTDAVEEQTENAVEEQKERPAEEQALQPVGAKTLATMPEDEAVRALKERNDISIDELLAAAEGMFGLAGEMPSMGIIKQRKAGVTALLELIASRLQRSAAASSDEPLKLKPEEIMRLLRIPCISEHDQVLTKVCENALTGVARPMLLKVVQRATIVECSGVAEAALVAGLQMLNYVDADEGAAFLAALARAGARVDRLAVALRSRATCMSAPALAATILALCDKNASSEVLRPVAERLATKAPFTSLSRETLVALAVAATTKASLGIALNAVTKAATADAAKWSAEEMVKLLLALVKAKEHLQMDVRESFLREAVAMLRPKLKDFEVADLLKVTLAASGHGSGELLEAAAAEVGVCMADVALPQLLLLTQALAQGLPPSHAVLQQLLGLWSDKLKAGGSFFHDVENLVKLATASVPTMRLGVAGESGEARVRFVAALCGKLEGHVSDLSQVSRDLLKPEFEPEGAFGSANRRGQLLYKLSEKVHAEKVKKRDRSRSPVPLSRAEATRELKAADVAKKKGEKEANPGQVPASKPSKKRPLEGANTSEGANKSDNPKRKGTKKRRAAGRRAGNADF